MDEENKETQGYGKRPLWQWFMLYAVIAVVAYGLIYYFVLAKNSGSNSTQAGVYQQNASPTTQQPTSAAAVEKITVDGNEFAFTPSMITLKNGQTAEITFKNTGKYAHNLTISDLGVKSKIVQPGEQDTFTVTPDKIGKFAFVCTIPGHADKGMKGILTVE